MLSGSDGGSCRGWIAHHQMLHSDGDAGASLTIDLGAEKLVKFVRIFHAGAGGESTEWNTDHFEILISSTPSGLFTEAVKIPKQSQQCQVSWNRKNGPIHSPPYHQAWH